MHPTEPGPRRAAPELADTIVAEATPPGRAGLAVVRLSGPRAHSVAGAVFRPSRPGLAPGRRCRHGHVRLPDGTPDEATCTLFRSPSSFTGEDVAEIGVHGSPWVVAAVLAAATDAGARPARPGEFAWRAFVHGRLDLTRAEALDALVRASCPRAAAAAARQADGELAERARLLQGRLLDVLAELEAAIDFDDDSAGQRRIDEALAAAEDEAVRWRQALGASAVLEDGFSIVLAGPVNAGKSSLFNALLGEDRAIVTDEPGTTRDVIDAALVVDGLLLLLRDAAGDRQAESAAEAEGLRRALLAQASAGLVVHVRDAAAGHPTWPSGSDRQLCVLTKADLVPDRAGLQADHVVSSRTGEGIEALRGALGGVALARAEGDGPVLVSARQREVAARLCGALEEAASARRARHPEEYVAASVREALEALGELLGHGDVEDVYERVFRRFCVGK